MFRPMMADAIARLAHRLPPAPLTRFAPSPTGYLHLGHVANAIYVWGIARAIGGRVLLRLEDHDRGRCRAEYEAALLDDLAWLGLEPDVGSPEEFRAGPSSLRQSECGTVYADMLDRLARTQRVYACACSRKDIAADVGGPSNEESRYLGRCRTLGLAAMPGHGIRIVMEDGIERFDDALLGPQEQCPAAQCGDLLLRDRLGRWTYQFAVTADDLRHDIDLVIRGDDLLASTGRQLRLAHLLGRVAPPVYLHHPLIRKHSGEKLSKSSHDTGIRDLRAAGERAAAILGRAAYLTGLLRAPRDLMAEELPDLFRC
jgi:glutamyl-tRNA synthetase/glutamyl-Q tRNA(Asp) synthetase